MSEPGSPAALHTSISPALSTAHRAFIFRDIAACKADKQKGSNMFQKGQSGNPAGRPKKGQALTDILKTVVDKRKLAEKLLELAYDGDITAIKYVYDRVDGKPMQSFEHGLPEKAVFTLSIGDDDSE